MVDGWIEDPVLKLRMRLRTEGETLFGEVEFQPGGHIGRHFHPRQVENWKVDQGRLTLRLGRRRLTLGNGEEVEVPAGVRHSLRNGGAWVGPAPFFGGV